MWNFHCCGVLPRITLIRQELLVLKTKCGPYLGPGTGFPFLTTNLSTSVTKNEHKVVPKGMKTIKYPFFPPYQFLVQKSGKTHNRRCNSPAVCISFPRPGPEDPAGRCPEDGEDH